ncbi:MAG: hypothetical protein LBE31_09660 [Deltaproteobacteria bacterium]|jgi:hypothetical protein|nr:hypothetical protein [Deltaproteobacteria bacterium]
MRKKKIEEIIEELSVQLAFKDTTELGDVVMLITEEKFGYYGINFAHVVSLEPKIINEVEWWQVGLIILSIPLSGQQLIVQKVNLSERPLFSLRSRKVFLKAVDTKLFMSALEPTSLMEFCRPSTEAVEEEEDHHAKAKKFRHNFATRPKKPLRRSKLRPRPTPDLKLIK